MGYTRRASARRSDPAHEATDEAKFTRALGSEATRGRVKAKFPDENQASVSEAAAAAVAASASDSEEGNGLEE